MNEDKNKYSFLTLVSTTTGEELVLNNVLITTGRQNTIVETVVVGHSGTVKEFISTQDWNIDIQINVLTPDDSEDITAYPLEEVRKIISYLDTHKSVTVINNYCDMLDIHTIVIKGASLGQSTHSNQQYISVNATSDTEFEMVLNE
jgi:hypothetical protein